MSSTYRLSPKRRHRWLMRAVLSALLVAIICISGLAGVATYSGLAPVGGDTQKHYVTISMGSNAVQIGRQLQNAGLVRSGQVFEWYVTLRGYRNKLQAGTYSFTPSQSLPDIAEAIARGKVASDLVTILPGQRLDQVREMFIKSGFSTESVDAAFQLDQYRGSASVLANVPAAATLEGFLYPDSYQKTATTDPKVIIAEALAEMQQHLTPDITAGFKAHDLSIYQGVTLASVVEQEVPTQSDRNQVAQVFLKRLQLGTLLGSDVTAYYGSIKAGLAPSVQYDSPYNTRLHAGLPFGPIATVGDSALMAVAHPASTDWLYFVAGDDGVTHFSRTIEEHNANVSKYCHTLCSQNPQ